MTSDNNFLKLKGALIKKVFDHTCYGIDEFYEKVICDQFSHREAIINIHRTLIEYIEAKDAYFFIRLYGSFKKEEYFKQRRGFLNHYPNGIKTIFCDNTFTLIFTGMKLNGFTYTKRDLFDLFKSKDLVVAFSQVSEERELAVYNGKGGIRYDLNSAGWYQAHIKPVGKMYSHVKSLRDIFPNPDRHEFVPNGIRTVKNDLNEFELKVLKAHFLRLIHPFNSFLVPKPAHVIYEGKNLGEEHELINYVKNRLTESFPVQFEEFDRLSLPTVTIEDSKRIKTIKLLAQPRIVKKAKEYNSLKEKGLEVEKNLKLPLNKTQGKIYRMKQRPNKNMLANLIFNTVGIDIKKDSFNISTINSSGIYSVEPNKNSPHSEWFLCLIDTRSMLAHLFKLPANAEVYKRLYFREDKQRFRLIFNLSDLDFLEKLSGERFNKYLIESFSIENPEIFN